MKIVLYSLLLSLVLASAMPLAILASAPTYTGPRVERVSGQSLQGSVDAVIYHDKESGIEVLCFYNSRDDNNSSLHLNSAYAASMSCIATGRKW